MKPQDSTAKFVYALDQAKGLQAPGGLLRLTGWIAAGWHTTPKVRLLLSGRCVFDCRVGGARPDVQPAHPDLIDSARSGFQLETPIPAGFHIGTLEYCADGSPEWIPFHTLSIISDLSPLCLQLESFPPAPGSETWMVQGWCFHPQLDIENLTVQFAHSTTSLNTRLPRPDVARVFPQFNSASESGFAGHLSLVAGKGPVMLNAKLRNGSLLRQILLPELNIADETLLAAERNACTARARRIRLTAAKQAVVSIIIPIHNQLELTLGCLESIQRNTGETSFEVIVIDDKSEPFVAETLQRIANLRVFTNAENRGFILNCNFGAEKARGEHLVFLNNDTEVSPGWLESLLSVLATKPDAGAVGAKLIFPDGSLQDAGGLIWSDGTCWNYGKGDEPDQPEYNYVRRVDYCTGACVMVRRDLFQKIGGFDERFCPAYYEDVDLAFKIRRQGLHVYFQPDARITHFEGMSSGKSTAGGVKRNQLINQEKFRGKWAAELVHYGDGPYLAELARDRFCNERILVIDACALTPDMDAGSLRMFNLLTILADTGMKVTFAAENLQFHEPFSTELRQAGVEHLGAPHCSNLERHLEEFGFSYDAIIISRKAIAARFLPVARKFAPAAKVIFDTVDLMFLRLDRQADLEKSADLRTQASISKLQELSLARAADLTYVVSEEEASVLSKEVAAEKLAVVPLINPTRIPDTPFEKRWGLLFVGGYQHPPNLDAVLFFLDEILPIVRRSIPEIDVHIVGSRTPPSLSARAGERIHIHGFVADMDPLLDSVRLSIAPLRFGAGVKGKINQSMACGVPVVATNMAIEGMHLTAESDCLVADTPLDFAGAVCRLHQDPSLWQKLSTAGIAHVDRYFSFKRVRSQLANSFQRLGIVGRRKPLELPARPFHEFPLGSGVVCSPDGAAVPFLAAGWDPASSGHHWSVSKKAGLRFKLPVDAGDFRLTAKLFPLLVDNRVARQRIEITAAGSGENAGWDLVQGGVTEINFNFTLEPRHHGIVELEWRFPDAFKPVNFGLSVDERWLAVGLIEFGLTRNSR